MPSPALKTGATKSVRPKGMKIASVITGPEVIEAILGHHPARRWTHGSRLE